MLVDRPSIILGIASSRGAAAPRAAPPPIVIDDDILSVQRQLRRRLFEGETAIRWRPGRELAAQLLLYLDDPQACWRITADWLRETLDADRVDGGFGGYISAGGQVRDYVVMAEVQRDSLALPSVLGLRFSAADPALRAVWADVGVAAITDVSQERSFTEGMRVALGSIGTRAKLALPVRDGLKPLGIICADWHRETPAWDASTCNELDGLSHSALGPVLATAALLAAERRESECPQAGEPRETPLPAGLRQLTSAEMKVARLVAMGLSYKEVARQLQRSLSTVDHQLRSIRDKLGVSSTSRLVRLLNVQFDRLPPEH